MIGIENIPQGETLFVNGQNVLPDETGCFSVTHEMIHEEDLTVLPAGTYINVRHPGYVTRNHENEFVVHGVHVQADRMVLVTATLYRCECCWKHSFSYKEYFRMVTDRLIAEESTKTGFFSNSRNTTTPISLCTI